MNNARMFELCYLFLICKLRKEGLRLSRSLRKQVGDFAKRHDLDPHTAFAFAQCVIFDLVDQVLPLPEGVSFSFSGSLPAVPKPEIDKVAHLYLIDLLSRDGLNVADDMHRNLKRVAESIKCTPEEMQIFSGSLVRAVVCNVFESKVRSDVDKDVRGGICELEILRQG